MTTMLAMLVPRRSAAAITWGGSALIGAIAAWLYAQWSLNHDAAVYLLIARGLAEGRVLYVDFPDYSMPANAWLGVFSLRLARGLGLTLAYVHQAVLFLLTAAGATLTGVIIARGCGVASLAGRVMPPLVMWLFLVTPGYDFGQRDVLFAVLAAPLVAMVAARHFGLAPGWGLVVAVALLAAAGSALKPHVGLPLLVLAAAELALRRGRLAALAPELWLTGGVLALYAVVVQLHYPTYFTEVLPGAARINGFIQGGLVPVLLSLLPAAVVGLAAALLLVLPRRRVAWGVILAWAAFGLALALMKVLQFQEFRYHGFPALLYASISLGLFAALRAEAMLHQAGGPLRSAGLAVAVLVLLAAAMPSPWPATLSRTAALADPVTQHLRALPHGAPVLALQTGVRPISPLHAYADIRWSGAFNENHEVAAIVQDQAAALAAGRPRDPFLVALEQHVRGAVLRSLLVQPPALVLVDVSQPLRWFEHHAAPFALLPWFLQDPEFARAWAAYVHVETVASLGGRRVAVWRRRN